MQQIPKLIEFITNQNGTKTMSIDGQEFPWPIVRDSVSVSFLGSMAKVTLTMFCEEVSVVRQHDPEDYVV